LTRNELIIQLTQGVKKKVHKGNSIWCIKNNQIYYYDMWKDEQWVYNEETEGNFSQDNCPLTFFNETKTIDAPWRKRCENYRKHIQDTRQSIKDLFNSCEEHERVKVTLKPRDGYRLNVYELIVEEVQSLLSGRSSTNVLYRIKPQLVSKIEKVTLNVDFGNPAL